MLLRKVKGNLRTGLIDSNNFIASRTLPSLMAIFNLSSSDFDITFLQIVAFFSATYL
jgi:hypothetical protein